MSTDGQWVRTYNQASVQLFLAERERELAELAARRQRAHEFRRRAWRSLRTHRAARKQSV